HALVGGDQQVGGADDHGVTVGEGAADQVAKVAVVLALQEAVVGHPVVVVHLRQVLVTGVGHQYQDVLGGGLLAAVLECGGQQGAGGRAAQDAFLLQQL